MEGPALLAMPCVQDGGMQGYIEDSGLVGSDNELEGNGNAGQEHEFEYELKLVVVVGYADG